MSYYDHFDDDGDDDKNFAETVLVWIAIAVLILVLAMFYGCAAHHTPCVKPAKPVIHPGGDYAHPQLTPLGVGLCKIGFLKLFGSYGPRNCKNESDAKP